MKNKVAFIGHPLSASNLALMSGFPSFFHPFFKKFILKSSLRKKKPFIVNETRNLRSDKGAQVDFIAIACPFLPKEIAFLSEEQAVEKVIEAVLFAKQQKANIVVLGGFTSVVGNEGEKVAKAVDITVTSGNTYTAALAIDGILKAVNLVNLLLQDARCTVIGATGDIGSACARYFVNRVRSLNLLARKADRVEAFGEELKSFGKAEIKTFTKIQEAVKHTDVIISATSALTTIIDHRNLKKGTVICDVSLPANIAREVARERPDLLVFEGGLCRLPDESKIKGNAWAELMPPKSVYGCLAEGLIMGFENIKENFSLGRGNIQEEKMVYIKEVATKHGFKLADFFSGDKAYSTEDIVYIKSKAGRG